MIVVLAGAIGRSGVGGLAWMSMQYLAGLKALGHEVYYLEDCGDESWVYDWDAEPPVAVSVKVTCKVVPS